MPMTVATHHLGDLVVNIYDFPEVGDELPMHSHTAGSKTGHITVVAVGMVRVFGHEWEQINKAGDVIDISDEHDHSFRCMEAGSRIVNIGKWVK